MKLSRKYTCRSDLGLLEKYRYTPEEKAGQSPQARALYWRVFGPLWLQDLIVGTSIVLAVAPMVLLLGCVLLWQKLLSLRYDETGFCDDDTGGGFAIFYLAIAVLCWYWPMLGFIIFGLYLQFFFLFLFLGVMDDYDRKVRLGASKKSYLRPVKG